MWLPTTGYGGLYALAIRRGAETRSGVYLISPLLARRVAGQIPGKEKERILFAACTVFDRTAGRYRRLVHPMPFQSGYNQLSRRRERRLNRRLAVCAPKKVYLLMESVAIGSMMYPERRGRQPWHRGTA